MDVNARMWTESVHDIVIGLETVAVPAHRCRGYAMCCEKGEARELQSASTVAGHVCSVVCANARGFAAGTVPVVWGGGVESSLYQRVKNPQADNFGECNVGNFLGFRVFASAQ